MCLVDEQALHCICIRQTLSPSKHVKQHIEATYCKLSSSWGAQAMPRRDGRDGFDFSYMSNKDDSQGLGALDAVHG